MRASADGKDEHAGGGVQAVAGGDERSAGLESVEQAGTLGRAV